MIAMSWALGEFFTSYFQGPLTTRHYVLVGAILLGLASGALGSFALLRRQSLLGDAMAHAALPGVCLAFLFTGVKDPLYFLLGATATGMTGALLAMAITRHSRLKDDAAIGLILSVFFGIGIVLLTVIQKKGSGNQAGLDRFLFGQAASLSPRDVAVMAWLCSILLILVFLFYKEFKLLSFDRAFGASLGFPMRFFDAFLTALSVITVMVGLQAVGVVLMVALLILPAAAARQWTDQLGWMLVLAAGIGAFSGASGAIASTQYEKLPTGPVIVVAASVILLASLLCAPRRGLIPAWHRQWRYSRRIREENLLKALYHMGERTQSWSFLLESTAAALAVSPHQLRDKFQQLRRRGLTAFVETGWQLTATGLQRARQIVRNHRLWELYLTQQVDIAADHVHRDAEEMEHLLSPEVIRQLESSLESATLDPHGRPIPRESPR